MIFPALNPPFISWIFSYKHPFISWTINFNLFHGFFGSQTFKSPADTLGLRFFVDERLTVSHPWQSSCFLGQFLDDPIISRLTGAKRREWMGLGVAGMIIDSYCGFIPAFGTFLPLTVGFHTSLSVRVGTWGWRGARDTLLQHRLSDETDWRWCSPAKTKRSLHALVLTRLQLSSEVLAASGGAVSAGSFVVVVVV